MTAKEIFEKLGYIEKEKYLTFVEYVNEDGDRHIWFNKNNETIEVPEDEFDVSLLKAINKQIEELGWNK